MARRGPVKRQNVDSRIASRWASACARSICCASRSACAYVRTPCSASRSASAFARSVCSAARSASAFARSACSASRSPSVFARSACSRSKAVSGRRRGRRLLLRHHQAVFQQEVTERAKHRPAHVLPAVRPRDNVRPSRQLVDALLLRPIAPVGGREMQRDRPLQAPNSAPRLARELHPHELIGRQPGRRGRPTFGQAQIRLQAVPCECQSEAIACPRTVGVSLPGDPQVLEFGPLDVEKIAANPVFALDIDMHGADEIRVLQRGFHVFQMPGQPQIVVGLVANDPPARLTKHAIAMDFTVARPFREIEESDAGVGGPQTLDGRAHWVIHAVAEDEDLDVLDGLRLHARHCERQGCGAVSVGGNENASSVQGLNRQLRPLVRDHSAGGVGVPRQLPAIGAVVVVELAGHADNRRLIRADILPTVINPGRDDDQSLVSFPQHKLVDAAEGGRSVPAVIADDAKRAGRRKQAVDGETVKSPPPDSARERGGQSDLNDRSVRQPPVGAKGFRQMPVMMGDVHSSKFYRYCLVFLIFRPAGVSAGVVIRCNPISEPPKLCEIALSN
jgi:hypothetical protein